MAADIVGRYQRYKAGTKVVTSWLVRTASKISDLSTVLECLKKQDTFAEGSPKPRILSHELVELADVIRSAKPPIIVPNSILQVLDDVITARGHSHAWFISQPGTADANSSHAHFIQKLKNVQTLLRSCKVGSGPRDSGKATKSTSKTTTNDSIYLSNLFDTLEIEEPGANPLGQTPFRVVSKLTELSLEEDHGDRAIFALWCHLEDMNDCRVFVRECWLDVRSGITSSTVAGMVTEMSMGQIRRAHENFVAAWPQFSDFWSIKSYLNMDVLVNANVVYITSSQAKQQTIKGDARTADLLCAAAAMLLRTYSRATISYLAYFSSNFKWLKRLPHIECVGEISQDVVQRPRSAFERVLLSMVPELVPISVYHPGLPEFARPSHSASEFTDGLLEITTDIDRNVSEASMWLVITCAMTMDIQEIVGQGKSYIAYALITSASRVSDDIESWINWHLEKPGPRQLYVEERLKQCRKLQDGAQSLVDCVFAGQRLANTSDRKRTSSNERFKLHICRVQSPALETLPHVTGYTRCNFRAVVEENGIVSANEDSIVLLMAHLYKAACRYGIVTATWRDLDFAASQYDAKRPLVMETSVDARPETLLRNFVLDLGAEPTTLPKGCMPKLPSLETVSTASKMFKVAQTTWKLRAAMGAQIRVNELTGTQEDLPDIVRAWLTEQTAVAGASKGKKKRFSHRELHSTLKNSLAAKEPSTKLNWLGFTTFCFDTWYTLFNVARKSGLSLKGLPSKEVAYMYELMYLLLRSAVEAELASRPIEETPFGYAAKFLQGHLCTSDNATRYSKEAFRASSGEMPRSPLPWCNKRDPSKDEAVRKMQEAVPSLSIGSSRDVIDIFDSAGSIAKFEHEILPLARELMPNERCKTFAARNVTVAARDSIRNAPISSSGP